MAKTKVSQWDSVAANNTDINAININEGCPPSTINNAIREVMAQIKDLQGGYSGDTIPVASGGTGANNASDARTNLGITSIGTQDPSNVNITGGNITGLTNLTTNTFTASGTATSSGTLNITGSLKLDGSVGSNGQVLKSVGSTATPTWTTLGSMSTQNSSSVNITGGSVKTTGDLNVTGAFKLDGSTGSAGQVMVSNGSSATPTWGSGFPTGGIIMWSGSVASIPSGWRLCDGGGGTPDLRDRFVVGAGSTYAVDATGGSADAVVVSHSHTLSGTTGAGGSHSHKILANVGVTDTGGFGANDQVAKNSVGGLGNQDYTLCKTTTGATVGNSSTVGNHTHPLSGSTSSDGSSGTDKNLPPYYALAYIMKL